MPKLSILHLSDTHLKPLKDILEGFNADIIIHSGDALMRGDLGEGQKFLYEWETATERFRHKIYAPGNHDMTYGRNNFMWKQEFSKAGTIFLDGEGAEVEGIYFWGHSLIPWISSGYWYGESYEGERREALGNIPKRANTVIISHGPPRGVLDICQFKNLHGDITYGPNWGCAPLREYIYDHEPMAVLSGHLHSSRIVTGSPLEYMKTKSGKLTLVSNASICDEEYEPVFEPVLIEIEI